MEANAEWRSRGGVGGQQRSLKHSLGQKTVSSYRGSGEQFQTEGNVGLIAGDDFKLVLSHLDPEDIHSGTGLKVEAIDPNQ